MPVPSESAAARLSGRRRWLARLALAALSTLIGLFIGDRLLGMLTHTAERHLLRLPPHVAYRHRSGEFDYEFRTNSRGLRGPDIPLARPAGTYRIAVLGDSFVAGFGVAAEDMLTTQLQSLLEKQNVQVINLGRVGTSTVRELDVYQSLGRPYQPDVVVLVYFLGNDLREVVEEQEPDEMRGWRPQGTERGVAYRLFPNLYLELAMWKQNRELVVRLQPRTEDELLQSIDRMARQAGNDPSDARQRYRQLPIELRHEVERGLTPDHVVLPACYDPGQIQASLFPDDAFFARAWPRTERQLDRLRAAVAADDGKLALVVIPDAVQVSRAANEFARTIGYQVEPRWLEGTCRTEQALAAWAQSTGVPYLDLTETLRASSEPLYYRQDRHFNVAGHATAAKTLARFLATSGLLPDVPASP